MPARKLLSFAALLLFFLRFAQGQVVPPALGKTNTGTWWALSMKQDLDTLGSGGWLSATYLGAATISGANHQNPFRDFGIMVVNQEFHHQINHQWQYSLALSYRRQHLFNYKTSPGEPKPGSKQEFRIYGRFSRPISINRWTLTPTFRQEFSRFFTPDLGNQGENLRFRARIRLKLAYDLNESHSKRLIAYSEQLFAISQSDKPRRWGHFRYTDSRFSLYYSADHRKLPLTFNIGYMYNLIGIKETHSGHYLGLDIAWNNPF